MKVLAELGADAKRTIVAFNKIDKIRDNTVLMALRRHFPEAVFLSVHTGEGLEELVARMGDLVANGMVTREFRIPHSAGALMAQLHRLAKVVETHYEGDHVRIVAVLPERMATTLENLLKDGAGENLTSPTIFTDKMIATG